VISYDNRVVDNSGLNTVTVTKGALLDNSWTVGGVAVFNNDNSDSNFPPNEGRIIIAMFSSAPQSVNFAQVGEVVDIPFLARTNATLGGTQINLRQNNNPQGPQNTEINDGQLVLNPAPTNGANDSGINPRTGQNMAAGG